MTKFFRKYKIIFYFLNFFVILLNIFPGSLIGLLLYGDIKMQPQITADFVVSSNHFYVFVLLSVIGFLTFNKLGKTKKLVIYLIILSIILEVFHLIIPERSFQWQDLFGNLLGVIVVILIKEIINKYELHKK
tara:strand:- start:155 stop:550 length:396 start_codon:yes stop_codon:yes gene_type:complete